MGRSPPPLAGSARTGSARTPRLPAYDRTSRLHAFPRLSFSLPTTATTMVLVVSALQYAVRSEDPPRRLGENNNNYHPTSSTLYISLYTLQLRNDTNSNKLSVPYIPLVTLCLVSGRGRGQFVTMGGTAAQDISFCTLHKRG